MEQFTKRKRFSVVKLFDRIFVLDLFFLCFSVDYDHIYAQAAQRKYSRVADNKTTVVLEVRAHTKVPYQENVLRGYDMFLFRYVCWVVHIFYSLCRCRRVVREHQTVLCIKQQTKAAPTHNSGNGVHTDDTTEHGTATKEGTQWWEYENECADTESKNHTHAVRTMIQRITELSADIFEIQHSVCIRFGLCAPPNPDSQKLWTVNNKYDSIWKLSHGSNTWFSHAVLRLLINNFEDILF